MDYIPPKEVFPVEYAAEYLGVSIQVVRSLLRSKRLHGRKVGREWRVTLDDLRAYMAATEEK